MRLNGLAPSTNPDKKRMDGWMDGWMRPPSKPEAIRTLIQLADHARSMSRRTAGLIASGYTSSTSIPDAVDAELLSALNSILASVYLPNITNILDATPNLLIALYEALYRKRIPLVDRTPRSHTSFEARVKNVKILIGTIAHEGYIGKENALELGEIDPRKVCEKDKDTLRKLLWVLVKIARARTQRNSDHSLQDSSQRKAARRPSWNADKLSSGSLVKESRQVNSSADNESVLNSLHKSLQRRKELAGIQTVLPRPNHPNNKTIDWVQGLPSSFDPTEDSDDSDGDDSGPTQGTSVQPIAESSTSESTVLANAIPSASSNVVQSTPKQKSMSKRSPITFTPARSPPSKTSPRLPRPLKPKSYPHASYNISQPTLLVPDDEISPVPTVYLEKVSARILEMSSKILPKPSFVYGSDSGEVSCGRDKSETVDMVTVSPESSRARKSPTLGTDKVDEMLQPVEVEAKDTAKVCELNRNLPDDRRDMPSKTVTPEAKGLQVSPPCQLEIPSPDTAKRRSILLQRPGNSNSVLEGNIDGPTANPADISTENITSISIYREEHAGGRKRRVSFYINELEEPTENEDIQTDEIPTATANADIPSPATDRVGDIPTVNNISLISEVHDENILQSPIRQPSIGHVESPPCKLIEETLPIPPTLQEIPSLPPHVSVDLLSDNVPISLSMRALSPIRKASGSSVSIGDDQPRGIDSATKTPVRAAQKNEDQTEEKNETLLITLDDIAPSIPLPVSASTSYLGSSSPLASPEASQEISVSPDMAGDGEEERKPQTTHLVEQDGDLIEIDGGDNTDQVVGNGLQEHSLSSSRAQSPAILELESQSWMDYAPPLPSLPAFEDDGTDCDQIYTSTPRPLSKRFHSLSIETSPESTEHDTIASRERGIIPGNSKLLDSDSEDEEHYSRFAQEPCLESPVSEKSVADGIDAEKDGPLNAQSGEMENISSRRFRPPVTPPRRVYESGDEESDAGEISMEATSSWADTSDGIGDGDDEEEQEEDEEEEELEEDKEEEQEEDEDGDIEDNLDEQPDDSVQDESEVETEEKQEEAGLEEQEEVSEEQEEEQGVSEEHEGSTINSTAQVNNHQITNHKSESNDTHPNPITSSKSTAAPSAFSASAPFPNSPGNTQLTTKSADRKANSFISSSKRSLTTPPRRSSSNSRNLTPLSSRSPLGYPSTTLGTPFTPIRPRRLFQTPSLPNLPHSDPYPQPGQQDLSLSGARLSKRSNITASKSMPIHRPQLRTAPHTPSNIPIPTTDINKTHRHTSTPTLTPPTVPLSTLGGTGKAKQRSTSTVALLRRPKTAAATSSMSQSSPLPAFPSIGKGYNITGVITATPRRSMSFMTGPTPSIWELGRGDSEANAPRNVNDEKEEKQEQEEFMNMLDFGYGLNFSTVDDAPSKPIPPKEAGVQRKKGLVRNE